MAYKRKRKVYTLDFSGTEYEGLEIKVAGLSTGEFLDYIRVTGAQGDGTDSTEAMLTMLAKHLVSWNLTDENDVIVPLTVEGLRQNELDLNVLISTKWTDAISQVPESLGKASTSGGGSLLASIPAETL